MFFKTGDIFHCKSNGFIGRAIRWATKSNINHSAIFIEIWGQAYIIDSQSKGTNLIPFAEWTDKWKYKYIVHRDPHLTDHKQFAIRALSKSGNTGYDFESLLIRQPISLITGKWNHRERKENERMYCSEFAAWTHYIDISYRMTPKDLYNYCKENKYIEVYNGLAF
jgi:hypothetical protein